MADSYTPNLSLIKPEIGASRDSWGSKLNENADTIDEFLSMAMPCGAILDYAGPNPPPGWLACDGRAISRTTYSELFAAIGTAWGGGDGSTTFNLPPASGRASVGAGNVTDANGTVRAYGFAQRVGSLSYSILQANLPNITLNASSIAAHNHGGASGSAGGQTVGTSADGFHSHGGATGSAGTHTHVGTSDLIGDHSHYTVLPGQGTGAAAGGSSVMSTVFGTGNYNTSVAGAHQHSVAISSDGAHTHAIAGDASHGHSVTISAHTHTLAADGGHTHTVPLGGSATAFDVVQPVMVVSKIIYAGQQASSRTITSAAAGAGPTRHLAAPSRGRH